MSAENEVLVELMDDSYSGDEEAKASNVVPDDEISGIEKIQIRSRQRHDSGSSLDGERAISDELREKILAQAEYYFSDENLKRDGFLLKHVKRNKEGYVNLKLLASFKKMRSLSRDFKVFAEVLKNSTKLVVNETGLKVRRKDPVPKELFEMVRIKFVVVSRIPNENPSMDFVSNAFGEHKELIASVRIIKPGKQIPNDLQSHFSAHPEISSEVVAIVEFENPNIVPTVMQLNFDGDPIYNGLVVQLLELGAKQRNKKLKQLESSGEVASSDDDTAISTSSHKKKNSRVDDILAASSDYSNCSSSSENASENASENEAQPGFEMFGSCTRRFNRSHGETSSGGSSPQSSPNMKRRPDQLEVNNNKSVNRTPSPFRSPKSTPPQMRTPERFTGKDAVRRVSPLVRGASPIGWRNSGGASSEQRDSDSDSGRNDWMTRRMNSATAAAAANNGRSCSPNLQFQIIRQPRGPDASGAIGFNRPFEKQILVHAAC